LIPLLVVVYSPLFISPAAAEAAILPHGVADRVPFANLGDVLATFHIPAGSAEATEVRDTLIRCPGAARRRRGQVLHHLAGEHRAERHGHARHRRRQR
jgi:hypothetical protein